MPFSNPSFRDHDLKWEEKVLFVSYTGKRAWRSGGSGDSVHSVQGQE